MFHQVNFVYYIILRVLEVKYDEQIVNFFGIRKKVRIQNYIQSDVYYH